LRNIIPAYSIYCLSWTKALGIEENICLLGADRLSKLGNSDRILNGVGNKKNRVSVRNLDFVSLYGK